MIFTECPSCDESQAFGWEPGDGRGHFPSKCGKCGKVMWVAATSLGGETRDSESFRTQIMKKGDEDEITTAELEATNLNIIIIAT